MPTERPKTIAEYLDAAPCAGQAHLRKLYKLLRSVAPQAEEAMKWNTPFFIEPRFLFAFSGHKAHLSFAPGEKALEVFHEELKEHQTTKNFLQVPYDEPLPEKLIRKIAKYRVQVVSEREDDSFW